MEYTILNENKRKENGLFPGIQNILDDVISTPGHLGKVLSVGVKYGPIQALKYDSMINRARAKNEDLIGGGRIGGVYGYPIIGYNYRKGVNGVGGFYCQHNNVEFWEVADPVTSDYIVPLQDLTYHREK